MCKFGQNPSKISQNYSAGKKQADFNAHIDRIYTKNKIMSLDLPSGGGGGGGGIITCALPCLYA